MNECLLVQLKNLQKNPIRNHTEFTKEKFWKKKKKKDLGFSKGPNPN